MFRKDMNFKQESLAKETEYCILIVVNDKDLTDILHDGLRQRGYRMITASTEEEAFNKLKRERVDMVILDFALPGMSGIQTLEQIKKTDPELEVIMMTEYESEESVIESMKKGAYVCLHKHLSVEELNAVIKKVLEKRQLKDIVALYEISKNMFSTIHMDNLLKIIIDLTMKVLRADDASVMLFDEEEKLYIAGSSKLNEKIRKETRLAVGEGISGWVVEHKQPVIVIDRADKDPRFKHIKGREGIKSAIVIPLQKTDNVLGVLNISRINIIENFNKGDLQKANIFASMVSFALENANLFKELQEVREELVKINKELEQDEKAVLNMLSDLKKSHGELKASQEQLIQSEKLASLGRLVSNMAHEVNNPLMIISGRAQLSLMGKVSSGKIEKNLKIIIQECRRAKEIIQRLLQFTRTSKEKVIEVDINKSIEEIVSLIEYQFGLEDVKINRNYAEELLSVSVDEKQIQQVFMNLLRNAFEAMPDGGIIEITTYHENNFLGIDFKDTGRGIGKDILDKIIDPLFTTKEEGTGLGLSICYSILKTHDGELKFKSAEGKGTIATVRLPLNEAQNNV